MDELMIKSAIQYGIFAGLFVWLLIKTQNKNEAREEKYQEIIDKNQSVIEKQAKAFTSMSKDVNEIKKKIFEGDVA